MGRHPKFDRQDLLLIAAGEAAQGRAPTIQALAAASGAPVGSIYHRFDSREQLLAEAWLLAVERFQAAFMPPLVAAMTVEQGLAAALATPQWSRAHPELAGLLVLRRQDDFLGENTPEPLRRRAADLNKAAAAQLRQLARRTGRSLLQCRLAIVGVPYGAVRMFLPKSKPPREIDAMVAAAYRAIMALPPR